MEQPTLHQPIQFPITTSKKDPLRTMTALEFHGTQDVRIQSRPRPMITEPGDALIRVTLTTICGSDLHLYHGEFSGMEKGSVMGHECMGFIEEVGQDVKQFKPGDKVVVSAVISCGKCFYCKKELFSLCDNTNPSKEMEKEYGHRTSGLFGYSNLTGGYDGGQAEFIRVPIADVNLLKIPENIPDEKVLFLSDIICTAWHANELGGVSEGQTVVVWGAGPVGLLTMMFAKFRRAKQIVAIDALPYRLQVARERFGAEIINFAETDVLLKLRQLLPGGPDVCIDCVGFRFPKSLTHKLQRALKLETDSPQVLQECIFACRKGGVISVIGDYYMTANGYPIGAFFEKGLTMRGSQVFVQKYWKHLLGLIENGEIDPSFLISHRLPLEQAPEAYKIFDLKEENSIKVVLYPSAISHT